MYHILTKGVTTNHQLNQVGKHLFSTHWLGVFSSDVTKQRLMKRVLPGMNFSIINVDGSDKPGSHWLALVLDTNKHKWYIYDSFARKSKTLIPKFIRTIGYQYVDLNTGKDQKVNQNSCGARSMATLLYIKRHGVQSAKGI